jgi:cbb3-type cytochrome oxidase maturation protein
MEVLIYLVPMALALGLLGLIAFLWSLRNGQYDDLEGASWRAIMDEDGSYEDITNRLQAESAGDCRLSLSDGERSSCLPSETKSSSS